MFHNVDSPALDRRLADAPEDLPRHGTDLHRLYRYAHRGSHKHRNGYEIRALRQKYANEYAELMGEARGQGELL